MIINNDPQYPAVLEYPPLPTFFLPSVSSKPSIASRFSSSLLQLCLLSALPLVVGDSVKMLSEGTRASLALVLWCAVGWAVWCDGVEVEGWTAGCGTEVAWCTAGCGTEVDWWGVEAEGWAAGCNWWAAG